MIANIMNEQAEALAELGNRQSVKRNRAHEEVRTVPGVLVYNSSHHTVHGKGMSTMWQPKAA